MRRIALYGGSFNPPHVAHQLACAYVLATARPRVDRLWMVPTYKHPFDKQLAPYEDRLAMCRLAAEPFGGRVEVSEIEAELGGESYTLKTVQAIRSAQPDARVSVVIGADLLAERERWHGFEELRALVDFLVLGRAGFVSKEALELALPEVSSTEVRRRLGVGEQVDALVDVQVVDYIRRRGLYGARA
jgi:nicotinate-nucleotide adenylyltransferase